MDRSGRIAIGKLAKHTGTNIETVRYYERVGSPLMRFVPFCDSQTSASAHAPRFASSRKHISATCAPSSPISE